MAGSYPDAPSRRMGHDGDGSILLQRQAAPGLPWETYNGSEHAEANDEDSLNAKTTIAGGSLNHTALIFPELRELDGYFWASQSATATVLESSADTTNGIEGTWSTQIADVADFSDVYSNYRSQITSLAASGVRAIRQHWGPGLNAATRAVHVYGDITPGQTPDRLLFIDEATGLEFTAPKDYGDIPRGGSEDFPWRIRNNSAGLTATTIQYTSESLYLLSGAWYTHSLPGGSTFQSTRQVASLAPATTTGIITTRRVTPGTEALGLHAARVYLNVDTWS